MAGFDRRRRAGLDAQLAYVGRGWVSGQLYDVGLYPAAVPASEGRIWGEVYETTETDQVLAGLDEIEGYDAAEPDQSLYLRQQVTVTFPEGPVETSAWIYFYNAPLGHAELIPSGDYLAHFRR